MPEVPFVPLGREHVFFKYLNIGASLATLKNKTLKWSNARLFSDPFDMPADVSFAFDGASFANALLDEMSRLAFGAQTPVGDMNNPLFALCMQSRDNRKRGATEPEFRRYMSQSLTETAEQFTKAIPLLERQLEMMREQFALFCVSKTNKSLLMWAHYAHDHTGCVLGLRCLPDLDRPLCAVKEVKYLSEFPLVATLPEYVRHLTGQSELDTSAIFERFALAKSDDWSYEQEWRGLSLLTNRQSGFDLDPLLPEELDAVYFGARATLNKPLISMVTVSAASQSYARRDFWAAVVRFRSNECRIGPTGVLYAHCGRTHAIRRLRAR